MQNDKHYKILMVATEVVPFAKEGGVADVIGSLPRELASLGHDVRIFIPRYGSIDPQRLHLLPTGVQCDVPMTGTVQRVSIAHASLPGSPVVVYLLDHQGLFGRHHQMYLGLDQRDEQRRFLLFCRGVLTALP